MDANDVVDNQVNDESVKTPEKWALAEVLDEIAAGTDEYSGRGGSYVIDADTQTRKPNK